MNGAYGSVSGRVVDATGAPVSGASVAVSASPQPVSDIAAITGADGSFRLGGLAPGTYTLTAHSTGHAPGEADVVVLPGQQANLEIRLDDLFIAEAFLEVMLVTDLIDWSQVRMVRVSLNYNDPGQGVAVAKDFIFSPTNSASTVWKVELKDRDRDQYTYKVVYFMADGLQKTVGPEDENDRKLILDPQS